MLCSLKDISRIFRAVPFVGARTWQASQCPSAVEWTDKWCLSHTVKSRTAIKRHELLYALEGPHSPNVDQKKPDTKEYVLHDYTYESSSKSPVVIHVRMMATSWERRGGECISTGKGA